ncbi:MAG: CapA family protein [Clostridia bacterium]|nr:CapA family protein [Clostridia bacterium]
MKKLLSIILCFILCFSLTACTRIESDLTVPDTGDTTAPSPDTTEAATEPVPDSTVTLYMVGDVLLHERVTESGLRDDGTYNFDHFFAHVGDDISSADLALVNQEVILGGTSIGLSGYPAFNGPFEVGDALADAGFDVILHATNHALDRGSTGLLNCIGFWKTEHPDISVVGIYESQAEQDTVLIREVKDMKIAVLNYTYGTNGIPLPDGMPYAVNLLDEDKVISDLKYAEENADFTVVCPHWGTEYTHTPDDNQKYWANIFTENGADLVIGTHPHVIEPLETVNGVPVYWSLGNYINSTAQTGDGIADRMLGCAASVTLDRDSAGKVTVSDCGVIPLVCHVADGTDMTVYRLSDYTETLASENLIVGSDPNFSLEYCKNLASRIFGDIYPD